MECVLANLDTYLMTAANVLPTISLVKMKHVQVSIYQYAIQNTIIFCSEPECEKNVIECTNGVCTCEPGYLPNDCCDCAPDYQLGEDETCTSTYISICYTKHNYFFV